MAFNLAGKRVLVTGASQGIGRALAVTLAKCGCQVYAIARTESKLVSLKEECPSVTTITLDITNAEDVKAKLGNLKVMDGVVNNVAAHNFPAGIPALDVTKPDFDRLVDVNVWAAINITQIFARKMIESKRGGSIVNISSIMSTESRRNAMVYSVTKAALDMVSKQFALELGPYNIRVNSVNPTLVLTDAIKQSMQNADQNFDEFIRRTPRGRVAEVEEIVHPIMYLLSEYSSGVTGTTHLVDCGLLSTFSTS